jgi:biotin carboxylase
MRPRVAVVHHRRSFFPLDLFREVGKAVDLLWVVDDALLEDAAMCRLLRRLGTVVDVAGLDLDQAATRLAAHRPEGIVSFVDDHVTTAAGLAVRLGLPYHSPEVAATLVDKRRQRAALQKAGIPGPRFWPVSSGLTPSQATDLAQQVCYPAVLKPAEGTGSRGMRLVTTPGELVSELAAADSGMGFLLEEYLHDAPGRADEWYASYLSVESVVSDGRVSHLAFTGRFPLAEPFRETGNFIPGILDGGDLRRDVLEMVDATIDALDITSAVIHTEIKLTPDGPKLIEVNGRLGGRPPFVLRSVSNVNLFQVAFDVAVGMPVSFEGLAECRGVGYWLMLQPPISARRVATIEGLDEISALREVEIVSQQRHQGDAVDWREGTASQVVTVRGRVADHVALAETIEMIRHKVSIEYCS